MLIIDGLDRRPSGGTCCGGNHEALESLVAGRVVNEISVDPDVAKWARMALDQMLALPGEAAKD